ncbi:hypothetical protein K439DRAFT_1660301 [Ramaria rubella]|nr:hypothetical protein K439DRAFT_1660301 [Ramaria rubella]
MILEDGEWEIEEHTLIEPLGSHVHGDPGGFHSLKKPLLLAPAPTCRVIPIDYFLPLYIEANVSSHGPVTTSFTSPLHDPCHIQTNRRPRNKVKLSVNIGSNGNGTSSMSDPRRGLHERVTELQKRREELLNSLAELEQNLASKRHLVLNTLTPANSTTIRGVGRGSQNIDDSDSLSSDKDPYSVDQLAAAFGHTLSIKSGREKQFHGSTATADLQYILQERYEATSDFPHSPLTERSRLRSHGLKELAFYNWQFPCPPDQPPPDMTRFLAHLPPYERVMVLVEYYHARFGWLSLPVPIPDLHEIILLLYPGRQKTKKLHVSNSQRLAVLLGVLLLGTFLDYDLDEQQRLNEMDHYLTLVRAAMVSDPVIENTSLPGIHTTLILIWYFRLCPAGGGSLSYQWALTGVLNKLVQSIGLHRNGRDPSVYIQDPVALQRGEQTFWEYNSLDIWQSYMFGRPTSMTNEAVSCKQPTKIDVYPGHLPEFYAWKYSFASVVSDVVRATTSPTVNYGKILWYEKKLREYPIPAELVWQDEPVHNNENMGKTFQRCLVAVWQQLSIMYIHRPFFWELISEHPEKPVRHHYWRSIVAAYHSATTLVSYVRCLWLAYPQLLERMVPFWSHAHSAALVLGALVVLTPESQFAEGALEHFDVVCDMFREAEDSLQQHSNRKTALIRLRTKAHNTFESFRDSANAPQHSDDRGLTGSPVTPASSTSIFSPTLGPDRTQNGQIQAELSHKAARHPIKGMPVEYEVYRQQEIGWDHLISCQLGMDSSP